MLNHFGVKSSAHHPAERKLDENSYVLALTLIQQEIASPDVDGARLESLGEQVNSIAQQMLNDPNIDWIAAENIAAMVGADNGGETVAELVDAIQLQILSDIYDVQSRRMARRSTPV